MFKTIDKSGKAQIIVKKSKFIANAFYVESVKEAEEIIDNIKRMYHDARHNCYAYRILEEASIIEKQTDDGEPAGSSGAPMLSMLQKNNLVNILVIVTRYFGGILLGTGGLVKAYSEASKLSIQNAKIVEKTNGYVVCVELEYNEQSEFEYMCEKNRINIISREYTDKIKNLIEISEEKFEEIFVKNEENKFHKLPINIKNKKYINII